MPHLQALIKFCTNLITNISCAVLVLCCLNNTTLMNSQGKLQERKEMKTKRKMALKAFPHFFCRVCLFDRERSVASSVFFSELLDQHPSDKDRNLINKSRTALFTSDVVRLSE